jgi:hypothetical protein
MKRITFLVLALGGLSVTARGQTNLVEWQTNWPGGSWTNIANYFGQQAPPVSSSWFTGTHAAVNGVANGPATNFVASVASGSSLTFFTYFAATNNASLTNLTSTPIHISPNQTIRATVNFFTTGTAPQNAARGLRLGLLYAGANANVTGGGNGSNIGLTGYGQDMNFGTFFGQPPLQTFAETNAQTSTSQLATSTVLGQIGDNGGGTTNDPGFDDDISYTLQLSVTENNPTNFSITTTFWGSTFLNGSNITQTVIDTNYCYTNFDEFIMRPAQGAEVALTLNLTSFKIEIITNSVVTISTNANLSALALAPAGALTPLFASNLLSYAATEAYASTPTIMVTDADPAATNQLTYNGVSLGLLPSGVPSAALTLNPNPEVTNVAKVQVTAPDGVTVQTYTVNITQLPSQTAPALVRSVNGGVLTLNWPLANSGYRLLYQTNNLNKGVSSNPNDWGTVPGSTLTNLSSITITHTNLDEYYRLVYP